MNNATAWATVRTAINNDGGKNYVIKVTGDFQLAGVSSNTFTSSTIKVLFYAPTNKTISASGDGYLLYAGASQTFILRNISLQGAAICSTNAHLVMRPGAVITKNTSSNGVYVDGGSFTMKGGTIYGKGAGTGLANTGSPGAALSIETGAIAKYGNGSNIIENGLASDETLVGHD